MDYHGSTAPFSRKNHQEVKHWSAKLQGKKGDCLPEGFVSELPSAVYPKFPEIKKVKELQAIWESWTVERQYAFTVKYGDIALLLSIEIDEQLLKAIILFCDPSYRCFTFNHENLPDSGRICCFTQNISIKSEQSFLKNQRRSRLGKS